MALCSAFWVVLQRQVSPGILNDSDTKGILDALAARHSPFSWFSTDWPLENHFYRPVSTLTFEFDRAFFGQHAAGYGWTNAILAGLCVLALYWLLTELTQKPLQSAFGAAVFAAWSTDILSASNWASYFALIPIVLAMIPGRSFAKAISSGLLILFTVTEFHRGQLIEGRIVDWLPGRTASAMTFFVLLGLAAFTRFVTKSCPQDPTPESPLNAPATRSSRQTTTATRAAGGWIGLGFVCLLLALGSYEQAVMMPALIVGLAVTLRLQRYRPLLWVIGAFWIGLIGYFVLRLQILGTSTSAYQNQQLRNGPDVFVSILDYLAPATRQVWQTLRSWAGWETLLTPNFWEAMIFGAANIAALGYLLREVRKRDTSAILAVSGLILSTLAFLPMAWLKHFDHYHYLPTALRTVMFLGLVGLCVQSAVSAGSLPVRQAPPRPDPAPGSLLHP